MTINEFLTANDIFFQTEVSLKEKSWIKRGGIVPLWVVPSKMSEFISLVIFCQKNHIDYDVIGATSNCYFLKGYSPTVLISTLKLKGFEMNDKTIKCDCGYNMMKLAKYCINEGIEGFEGFVNLPGTVGGAAINNSGCFGSLISEIVVEVHGIKDGEFQVLSNEEMNYTHRNSILKNDDRNFVITHVVFDITKKADPDILREKAEKNSHYRRTFQENRYPNLGSTFSSLKLKKLPFVRGIVYRLLLRVLGLLPFSERLRKKIKVRLIILFWKFGKVKRYISEYGVHCFVWKDENADDYFKSYLECVDKNKLKGDLEIEIKGDFEN